MSINTLEKRPEDKVVSGVTMSVQNGIEFINAARKKNYLSGVPIVLLTAGNSFVDLNSLEFKVDMFCMKNKFRETLLPSPQELCPTV